MQLSLTPVLLTAELFFLLYVFRRASGGTGLLRARLGLFWLWITVYSVLVSYLGYLGVYTADSLLPYLPALWLQVVTVAACVTPVLVSKGLRAELRSAVDHTTRTSFIRFHMLRLAALGTLLGAAKGTFPLYFELLVGVPDLLFALSCFWMLHRERTARLTDPQFLVWNLLGALVIVPAAPVVLQLGLPGPLQLFASEPDARTVFTFPMAIAPMIGVPLFVLTNLLVAWRLFERRGEC